ncbi:MAG TPA: two-component system response regulator [Candidatus Omnitrophica bacterium]|nr:two-component system response regulator [Candidatus Omnitrophota bacterium]
MSKKKILAVDDELEVLTLLEKRLSSAGYDVVTATNGKEAVELAKRERPALIVLDILMPGMDGSETAAVLHDDPNTKDIPILFLTCLFTKREEQFEGHEVGHNFFIAKPYDPADLLTEITKIIG